MRANQTVLLLTLAAGLALPGCTSSAPDTPITMPPAQLNVLRLAPGHRPLLADSVAFYAKRGENRQASIYFQDNQGGQGQEFLIFKVEGQALLRRPDGTPFQDGDSILISIKASPDSVLFDFQPHGLAFDPNHPASLNIEYGECGDDFNHDGVPSTPQDSLIQQQLAMWKQELLNDPFLKLQSANFEDAEEVEADVVGFTRFAIAY